MTGLDGKVAVVTGGTGVLGGAMARGLAAAGAKVAVMGRRQAQAEAIVTEITSAGGEAMPLPADVLDRAQLGPHAPYLLEGTRLEGEHDPIWRQQPDDATDDVVTAVAVGVLQLRHHSDPAGRDLEQAFASGVASAGGQAVLGGVLPTPAVALLALDLGAIRRTCREMRIPSNPISSPKRFPPVLR